MIRKRNTILIAVSAVLCLGASAVVFGMEASSSLVFSDASHDASCHFNHYERVDPTMDHYGSKEFWACCKHGTFVLEQPSEGHITECGSFSGQYFDALTSGDARYLAPSKQYYDGYYSALDTWTDGEDLKAKLHAIISGGTYQPITYAGTKTNWFSNTEADKSFTDREKVDALYSDDDIMANKTQTGWQREHAWPASLMTGSTTANAVKTLGRATDFHNLFAASTSGNTSRGNKNYGIANRSDSTFVNNLGKGGGYAYDSKTFEPGDRDKGRTARAIFYMATMYCEQVYDSTNGVTMKPLTIQEERVDYVAGNDCAFAIGCLSDLLTWSDFPVDYLEYQHNESVYTYVAPTHGDVSHNCAQGNRNPYVDYPGLVEYAFGSKKDQPGKLSDLVPSYESLHMGEDGIVSYAIETAKRDYEIGAKLGESDISVVAIKNNLSTVNCTDFSLSGMQIGDEFATLGNKTIAIITPKNTIAYTVMVSNVYDWQYAFAKADFSSIYTSADTENEVTLNGLRWTVWWEKGAISSSMSRGGLKFGVNASNPVGKVIFTTVEPFAKEDRTAVHTIAVSGAPASKNTCNIAFYVADELIGNKTMTYDKDTVLTFTQTLSTPKEGVIRIEITNATAPVIFTGLAVSAH